MRYFICLLALLAMALRSTAQPANPPAYTAANPALYRHILHMDSVLFDAYNHCKPDIIAAIFSKDIEFYHDQSGLSTSHAQLVKSIEQNICGKVRRELIAGSVEVYPLPGYGAVQFGLHQFYNAAEPGSKPHPSRFVCIWKQEGEQWVLTRVISTH
ncbi:MAG: nuclear transport factor 2 family protein [Chitinophagaceae bacterium]|nr:nuclear transport factor 2 family protein [Chitinophagaceae bacterium]